jgi:sugar/nucleoside kinase (ribokinase family)
VRSPDERPFGDGFPRHDIRVPFSLAVIGDIRVEARTELPHVVFPEIRGDVLAFAPTRLKIAGTGINMSAAGAAVFEHVTLVAKIGSDEFTPTIREYVRSLGITPGLVVDPALPNGSVLIVRDGSLASPGGFRLLVSSEPAPSHRLLDSEVESFRTDLARADLVFFDGYSIIRPDSAKAMIRVLDICADGGVPVCIDLVPHSLNEYIGISGLRPYIARADYVIAEARTMAALLSRPHEYPFSLANVRELIPCLDEYLPGNRHWILRFGLGDMAESLIYRRGEVLRQYDTGYAEAGPLEKAGYGDKIAVRELAALLLLSRQANERSRR